MIALRSTLLDQSESLLLGRTPERRRLMEYIQKGESVFVVGPEGCGKTELLRELYSSCDPKRALFVVHGSPTKDFLVSLALELARHGDLDEEPQPDRFERMRNAKLSRLCFEALRGKGYILFLDNVERMNATQQALMEPLVYENQIVMAASKMKALRWPHFQVVELKPLDEQTLQAVVDLYLDDHGIAAENRPLLRKSLVKLAGGNVKKLMGALERCRLEGYVTNDFIFEELGFREEREYIDVTPIILIGAALFIAVRFFGLGLNDTELYMFAGMGYAMAWVLRAFMWRWRKPKARSAS
jgi:energy-coupling factor transporter ATP-binding protein EcfA2